MSVDTSGSRQDIIKQEMHRWKHKELHSGSARGPIVTNPKQAIAIAYDIARRQGKADGGPAWYAKNEARSMLHTGPIRGSVPGRTDHIPMSVPNGSYVLPAAHVSHFGQNNTEAGFTRLNSMFSGAPFGAKPMPIHHGSGAPRAPGVRAGHLGGGNSGMTIGKMATGIFAEGGVVGHHGEDGVPIMAAAGEYVIPPHIVAEIGGGNIDHGHEILDEWVKRTKEKHIKVLKSLPGPAK
jgi:hypothetical protein